jgi:translation initiation factor SUI1
MGAVALLSYSLYAQHKCLIVGCPLQDLSCNGSIAEDEQFGKVIQVQGDQRMAIAEFFVAQKICKKNNIKVHGF